MEQLEVVVPGGALLGEGPIWDERGGRLLWVDITRGELHHFDPAGAGDEVVLRRDGPLAAVAVRAAGGLLLANGMDLVVVDGNAEEVVATADRGDRLNEARCDPAGRLWTGTLTEDQRPGESALYRLDERRVLTRVLDAVTLSNGTGWSPDGATMYYADTVAETIDAFDYDVSTGTASDRRTFVDLHDAPGRVCQRFVHGHIDLRIHHNRGEELLKILFDP